MTVIHVGATDHLKESFKDVKYYFFDYTDRDYNDYISWSGLYIWVGHAAIQLGADLVIFDFEKPEMINQTEFNGISMMVKCIIISPIFGADFMVETNNFLRLLSLVSEGKRPLTKKQIADHAFEIIAKLLKKNG